MNRLNKAVEIRSNLKNAKLDVSEFPELQLFIDLLENWVKTGESISDRIYVRKLNKYLWYQLTSNSETTVVKLTKK